MLCSRLDLSFHWTLFSRLDVHLFSHVCASFLFFLWHGIFISWLFGRTCGTCFYPFLVVYFFVCFTLHGPCCRRLVVTWLAQSDARVIGGNHLFTHLFAVAIYLFIVCETHKKMCTVHRCANFKFAIFQAARKWVCINKNEIMNNLNLWGIVITWYILHNIHNGICIHSHKYILCISINDKW